MSKNLSLFGRRMLWVPLLIAAVSILTLASSQANVPPGCEHVAGKLYNGNPSRMIGGISGTYTITGFFCNYPDNYPVTFGCTISEVSGNEGKLYFNEYYAIDFTKNIGYNGAVMVMITGGEGNWEGASGNIILSGYFHPLYSQGEWSYQGEVCR